jgi:hypothetical protein
MDNVTKHKLFRSFDGVILLHLSLEHMTGTWTCYTKKQLQTVSWAQQKDNKYLQQPCFDVKAIANGPPSGRPIARPNAQRAPRVYGPTQLVTLLQATTFV